MGATNPSVFVEVSPAVQVPVGILCACLRIRPAHQRSEVRAQLTQALQDSQTLYYKTLSIIGFTEAVLPSERSCRRWASVESMKTAYLMLTHRIQGRKEGLNLG